MTLSTKECDLLKDMQSQEKLCVEKYQKYAQSAKSSELSCLLGQIGAKEQEHLDTINTMMAGNLPAAPSGSLQANDAHCGTYTYKNEADRQADAFLCQDLLTTEKHVSALYNTSVFEFSAPEARKMLAHIQAEEQQHGQQLYAYMKQNQMY